MKTNPSIKEIDLVNSNLRKLQAIGDLMMVAGDSRDAALPDETLSQLGLIISDLAAEPLK